MSLASLMKTFKSSLLVFIDRPRFTCIQEGRQNTCLIDNDLCCEFEAMLRPNTFFKTKKKDTEAFSMHKTISLSKLHPSAKGAVKIYKRVYHV